MKRHLDWTIHVTETGHAVSDGWPNGFDPDRRKWASETRPAANRLKAAIRRAIRRRRKPRDP